MNNVKELSNVRFTLLGVDSEVGPICGFAFCHKNEKDAKQFYSYIHHYVTAKGGFKRLDVLFSSMPLSKKFVKLDFHMTTSEKTLKTIVSNISRDDLNNLLKSLEKYKYYFILAGYTDDNDQFEALPPAQYHIFKSDLYFDDAHIFGNKNGQWPANNPFTDE